MLVSTEDQEPVELEHQVMTLPQDNHGDLHGQVVLVQEMKVELYLVYLVLLELYLVLVVMVHGEMVLLVVLAVVSQVYFTMESYSLVLAVEAVAVDQVVVTMVVRHMTVAMMVVTLQDLLMH